MNAGDCYCNKDWPRSTFCVLECLRAFSPALLSETNGGPSHLMPSVFLCANFRPQHRLPSSTRHSLVLTMQALHRKWRFLLKFIGLIWFNWDLELPKVKDYILMYLMYLMYSYLLWLRRCGLRSMMLQASARETQKPNMCEEQFWIPNFLLKSQCSEGKADGPARGFYIPVPRSVASWCRGVSMWSIWSMCARYFSFSSSGALNRWSWSNDEKLEEKTQEKLKRSSPMLCSAHFGIGMKC